MTASPEDPPEGPTRRRRPVAVPLAALTAASCLAIVAALGGLATAPDRPPKRLGPGATLDQEQFSTRFVESRTVSEPGAFGGPAKRLLEIEFEVVNKGEETASMGLPYSGGPGGPSFGSSLLAITPRLGGTYGPSVSGPGGEGGQLHPALPARVVVAYELTEGQQAPRELTIDVGRYEFREGITLTPGWHLVTKGEGKKQRPVTAARVTLPVVPKGTRS
ncbi:hypothetical protein [Streptosporangium longisporum]|uniref:DUF4352 domain-containing protein n=1 Tax=Streptosporangium longisporum TaxID=46187 RepID=A0ABN3XTT4_9ACTN